MWARDEGTREVWRREKKTSKDVLDLPVMQLRNCFLYVLFIIDTPLHCTSLHAACLQWRKGEKYEEILCVDFNRRRKREKKVRKHLFYQKLRSESFLAVSVDECAFEKKRELARIQHFSEITAHE